VFDPADNAGFQPYLDAMRVKGGFGEDVLNPAPGQVSGSLVLLLDHLDQAARGNVFSVGSIHDVNLGLYTLNVMFLFVLLREIPVFELFSIIIESVILSDPRSLTNLIARITNIC
jgi:hypothetical protein